MKLGKIDIPELFKKHVPPGFKFIQREDHDFLVVDSIFCRHGHDLLVDSVQIHGQPSIKLDVSIENRQGVMYIDSYWGSHAKLFSFFPGYIHDHALVEARCPHCGVSMMEPYQCDEEGCNSDTGIVFYLPGEQNRVHVCAKLNCPSHRLEIIDIPSDLVKTISHINFFGEGIEDLFGDF